MKKKLDQYVVRSKDLKMSINNENKNREAKFMSKIAKSDCFELEIEKKESIDDDEYLKALQDDNPNN
jgi:hypothetical protein